MQTLGLLLWYHLLTVPNSYNSYSNYEIKLFSFHLLSNPKLGTDMFMEQVGKQIVCILQVVYQNRPKLHANL